MNFPSNLPTVRALQSMEVVRFKDGTKPEEELVCKRPGEDEHARLVRHGAEASARHDLTSSRNDARGIENSGTVEHATNQSLGVEDRVAWIRRALVFRSFPSETFRARERHVRGEGTISPRQKSETERGGGKRR
jgi:hypothetical protein